MSGRERMTDADRSAWLAQQDARPCAERGWCNPTVPVCDCGYRWEVQVRESDGQVRSYTTRTVRDRYIALYGAPSTFTYEEIAS